MIREIKKYVFFGIVGVFEYIYRFWISFISKYNIKVFYLFSFIIKDEGFYICEFRFFG